jgi:hypothetical protein
MSSFQQFLDEARRDHTDHPDAVAARLEGGLPHLARPEDVGPYVSFAVHVFGEHLGEWQRGAKLLEAIGALPQAAGHDATGMAVRRGIAALRYASGDASAIEGLAPADLAQVMCVICTTHVARHETEAAINALANALSAAQLQGLPDKHPATRSLAVAGNNLSAELEGKTELTESERAAMVLAAETGLTYWKLAGTWLEEERAEYRLARCLLRAGEPDRARERIRNCIAICEANNAPAFEQFFAHAVLALAERAVGDAQAFAAARHAALAQYARISKEEQGWCTRELGELGA